MWNATRKVIAIGLVVGMSVIGIVVFSNDSDYTADAWIATRYTDQAGEWTNYSVWNGDTLPIASDLVEIRHNIDTVDDDPETPDDGGHLLVCYRLNILAGAKLTITLIAKTPVVPPRLIIIPHTPVADPLSPIGSDSIMTAWLIGN